MNYIWDFSYIRSGISGYVHGALITIHLTIICCITGTIVGMFLALIAQAHPIFRKIIMGGIFLLRGVPELVLLFFFYFFPYKQTFGITPPEPFWCAFMGFSLSLSIFTCGLFDSAISQLPKNQLLGARALGLNKAELFRHVIFPNVIKATLPGLLAFWISILKLTSLASVIGVRDVVYVAKIGMSENARALEAWTVVALLYIFLVFPLSFIASKLEELPWMKHQ